MAQYARPDSDLATSTWQPSTGSYLYACLDETSYDDDDNIYLTNGSSKTCQLRLSDVIDPGVSSGHTIRIRAKRTGIATTKFELYQGSTKIAEYTPTLTTSYADYSYTLSSGEAGSITDYTDLKLYITGTANKAYFKAYVSWAAFEVPDAPGLNFAGSVVKAVAHSAAGELTPAGMAYKRTATSKTGELSFSGAVSTIKTYLRTLSGTLTSAGTLVRATGKRVTGSLTSKGEAIKRTAHSLAGSLTASGALAKIKATLKSLAGMLTMSGSVSRVAAFVRTLSGTLTASGSLVRSIGKKLAGALSWIGSFTGLRYWPVTPIVRGWTLHTRALNWTVNKRSTSWTLDDESR